MTEILRCDSTRGWGGVRAFMPPVLKLLEGEAVGSQWMFQAPGDISICWELLSQRLHSKEKDVLVFFCSSCFPFLYISSLVFGPTFCTFKIFAENEWQCGWISHCSNSKPATGPGWWKETWLQSPDGNYLQRGEIPTPPFSVGSRFEVWLPPCGRSHHYIYVQHKGKGQLGQPSEALKASFSRAMCCSVLIPVSWGNGDINIGKKLRRIQDS